MLIAIVVYRVLGTQTRINNYKIKKEIILKLQPSSGKVCKSP